MGNLTLPPELNVKGFRGPKDDATLDLRYFPLTIIKFRGDASEEVIHQYYKWRKEASAFAHKNGAVHIVIKDIDDWGVPKPTIRKLIGDYTQKDKEHVGFIWRFLLVTKPIMRGAITAIVWLRGEASMYSFVGSYAEAIENAKKMFLEHNVEPPNITAASYVFPAPK